MKKIIAILIVLIFGNAVAVDAISALDMNTQDMNTQAQSDALPCEDRSTCEDERLEEEVSKKCTSPLHPTPPSALEGESSANYSTESMSDRHIFFTQLRPPNA